MDNKYNGELKNKIIKIGWLKAICTFQIHKEMHLSQTLKTKLSFAR